MTIIFLCEPVSINLAPVLKANKKPEHAAARSKPNAFFAPIFSAMRLAVAGKVKSGVMVAQMIPSISSGCVLV